ncbi:hypothetical protein Skr01_14590 [Sphaerisporangium krabiense]|uniref:Uncharacterized protein n=1 Tax=Sphaerisporangium krabiense TaxID=763782 RepID=A0A7W9DN57_9ACTN|nr:hypothetical protein [Sphaerisporangium krabiense]GII61374.1 hypothetical protein Skr01_14590 [Sphaerisporangium krabiense]
MSWLVLAFIVAVAVLAPLFGADTRDGRDWKPRAVHAPRVTGRLSALRTRDSRVPASAARVPVAAARRVRAGA